MLLLCEPSVSSCRVARRVGSPTAADHRARWRHGIVLIILCDEPGDWLISILIVFVEHAGGAIGSYPPETGPVVIVVLIDEK